MTAPSPLTAVRQPPSSVGPLHWVDSDAALPTGSATPVRSTGSYDADRRPVILCLHGIGSSSASFSTQLSGLAPAHRLLAWDAPGYGASGDPLAPPGMAGYAEAVVDLMHRMGRRVHLLGVSWGAVVALQVALRARHLLHGVVLVGASRGSGRSAEAASSMRARADELRVVGAEAFARSRAPRLVSPGASEELVSTVTQIMASAVRLPGYAYAAEAMASTNLSEQLHDVDVPVLALYGEHDTVTGPPEGEAIAGGIRGAVSVSVARAGHLANQEQPEAVNAWIASFVQIAHRLNPDRPPPT